MISNLLLVALGAASTVSALVPRAVCNADNCLRGLWILRCISLWDSADIQSAALRASSPQTRQAQASQDCAAYLVVTVTPPVSWVFRLFICIFEPLRVYLKHVLISCSTVTDFSTISSTETLVEEATAVNTIHTTVTSVVHETNTKTLFTSIATITQTVGGGNTPAKRDAPKIPVYALACSNTVRYSSACSCIGVTAAQSTFTASASTTTITVPTTIYETSQETATVATTDVTVIDTTITETRTVSETISTVTTTTITVSAPSVTALTLELQAAGRAPGVLSTTPSGSVDIAVYTTDVSKASALSLKPDGTLWLGDKVAYGHENSLNLQFFFYTGTTTRKPLKCTIDANLIMTCQVPGQSNNKVGTSSASTTLYTGTEANLRASFQFVTLKAILP